MSHAPERANFFGGEGEGGGDAQVVKSCDLSKKAKGYREHFFNIELLKILKFDFLGFKQGQWQAKWFG